MMMKKTGLLAVLTAGVLLFAGCGGEAKTIDAQALAKSLATEIKYDDTLKELTADEISMLVDLPEDVDSVMYAGSGSTAEEVGVFTAKDSNQAKETMEDVQKYLDDQADSFQDYVPEETKRIGNAVLEQKNQYVVLCVSGDSDQAKEIIEKAIWEYNKKYITHPREIPDIICVADLGVWKSQKMIVPNYDNVKGLKGNFVMSGYVASDNKEEFFTPVGVCVFDLLQNIAWRYSSVRDIVTYMRKLNIFGNARGYARPWEWAILSEETRKNIYKLKNGGFLDEWSMVID